MSPPHEEMGGLGKTCHKRAMKSSGSAAWPQFLMAKRLMLSEYDRAKGHANTQPVAVHHGNVGEAGFRNWLATFLPKRFGVTSGYIRSQGATPFQSSHYDVIIYDQLEAPILWVEENRDKADGGKARIIPAEYVGAVFEVKAAFNRRSVTDAIVKLGQLAPLVAGVDEPGERYPKFLPINAVFGFVFFELRQEDAKDIAALEAFRNLSFGRGFYGAVIMRGEGLAIDNTAKIESMIGDQPMNPLFPDAGLLNHIAMTGTLQVESRHCMAMAQWSGVNFSSFAFDVLALLNNTYKHGFASSFHGVDFSKWHEV